MSDIATPRGPIRVRIGGSGPPLLLLHGFPQTHLMWHSTAPALAESFTVIAADLPGYGDSLRPAVEADHTPHSKRAMAGDLAAAMGELGHARFAVAGHDRGGRVGYRMALDHPDAVTRLAVLDIVPTGEIWARADARFALGYWHWGFLAQPAPLPERFLLGDPETFWMVAERMGITSDSRYPEEVVSAYRAQCRDPATVQAMCEDYRAGATIDRGLDDADSGTRTIDCPVLVLWGAGGALPHFYADPLEPWRTLAPGATGHAVPDASHFLVEDQPEQVASELAGFF
ncbi:MAG TPA: alpha/beta hydrolase [Solirubrobacteraceae bacterium]